jgi:hypothetical protein
MVASDVTAAGSSTGLAWKAAVVAAASVRRCARLPDVDFVIA